VLLMKQRSAETVPLGELVEGRGGRIIRAIKEVKSQGDEKGLSG